MLSIVHIVYIFQVFYLINSGGAKHLREHYDGYYFDELVDEWDNISIAKDNRENLVSEHIFGDCRRKDLVNYETFKAHGSTGVLFKYLDLPGPPKCIIVRGFNSDTFRYPIPRFNIQVCVPCISYIHNGKVFKYYVLELYGHFNLYVNYTEVLLFGPEIENKDDD